MKYCVFITQKGGCGKSTLCDELAYSLKRSGIPSSLIDLDQQGRVLDPYEDDNAVITCVDTPGALGEDTAETIANADVLVIPSKSSAHDMPVLQRMIEAVKVNSKPSAKIFIVVNMFNRWSNCKNFLNWLNDEIDDSRIQICTLSQAEAFPKASAYGVSVIELEPRSRAATETKALMNKIREALNLPEEK